jgi:hypothetical protein
LFAKAGPFIETKTKLPMFWLTWPLFSVQSDFYNPPFSCQVHKLTSKLTAWLDSRSTEISPTQNWPYVHAFMHIGQHTSLHEEMNTTTFLKLVSVCYSFLHMYSCMCIHTYMSVGRLKIVKASIFP